MLNLPNIQPGATEILPRSDNRVAPTGQSGKDGHPFDQIMRQALFKAGSDQKSGSDILSQTGRSAVSLPPDSFNGAKYGMPPAEVKPAPAANTPARSDNPGKTRRLAPADQTKGVVPANANSAATGGPYSNAPVKPASIPTPIWSRGQDRTPTNSKGQNSGKPEVIAHLTASAAKVTPQSSNLFKPKVFSGSSRTSAILTSPASEVIGGKTSPIASTSAVPSPLPPNQGHNVTVTARQASSTAGMANSEVQAANQLPPTGPTAAIAPETDISGDLPAIVGGAAAITASIGDVAAGPNGQNSATSGTDYSPIAATVTGSYPANLNVANVPPGINGETSATTITSPTPTLVTLPGSTLSSSPSLSADENVASTLTQAASPNPQSPTPSGGNLFAKTLAKNEITNPQAISSIQQKTGAASEAVTSPDNPVPFIAEQLIPADGQNMSVATNPEAPLVTETKFTGSSANQPPSIGPIDTSALLSNTGGNPPSISDGTPSALVSKLMNNGGKSDNSAGLSGQLLPGSISVVAHATHSPSGISQASVGITTDALNAKISSTPEILTSAHGTESNSAVDLEQTHELVTTHAMRLENSGNTSLTVVIKPGGGTQMSLELRQQSNGIQAQAFLQQGDYKHLSQNWPELQQRLEQRGIRLAPLTDDGSSSFASSGGGQGSGLFGQSNPQPSEPSLSMGFGGTLTATTTAPGAPAKKAGGWETWA